MKLRPLGEAMIGVRGLLAPVQHIAPLLVRHTWSLLEPTIDSPHRDLWWFGSPGGLDAEFRQGEPWGAAYLHLPGASRSVLTP